MREGGRRGFEVLLLTISDAIPTVFDHRDEDGVVILGDRRLRERKQNLRQFSLDFRCAEGG